MAIISPGVGEFETVGQQIFALVETNAERLAVVLVQEGPAGTSFEVPDELHDRWLAAHGAQSTEDSDSESEEPQPPVRRRPGRPPRNPLPDQE